MDKKYSRKSASKWDQGGERALIEIWSEKMPQLRGCRKNSHIVMEMASELELQGFKYTAEELKSKMHNMTSRYRKDKNKIGSTGGSPSDWELYKDMENLLSPFKSYNPEGLVADSIKNMFSNIEEISPPTSQTTTDISPTSASQASSTILSPLPSPSPSKLLTSKKKNNIEKLINSIDITINGIKENIKETSEKMVAIEEEKKEILKSFADKEAKVQDAILKFLENN